VIRLTTGMTLAPLKLLNCRRYGSVDYMSRANLARPVPPLANLS